MREREREQDKTNKLHRTEKVEKMCILNVMENTLSKSWNNIRINRTKFLQAKDTYIHHVYSASWPLSQLDDTTKIYSKNYNKCLHN